MSATQVVQRANNSSNLYSTIKARGSNSGAAGCGYIYASEVNQCPCFRRKLKVIPQNSAGYDRTVRFELPNFGFLEHLYLESVFAQATGMGASDDAAERALCWGAGAFLFSEARVVFRGQEVARITSDYIMMRHLQDFSEERIDNFLDMVGGFPIGVQNAGGGATPRTGRYKLMADGDQRFYCPLNFWFTETRSRAMDLSILHSPVTIEVDVRPSSSIMDSGGQVTTEVDLKELTLQCYLAELPAPELKMFRDVSYSPGGQPLSQLGYDILTSTHTVSLATTTEHKIKLNDFSGLVQRLYIMAVATTGGRQANKYLQATDAITRIRLQSVDTDIYDREHMGYTFVNGKHDSLSTTGTATTQATITGERLMDRYHQPSRNLEKPFIMYDYDTDGAQVLPSAIHAINFKSDWDQRTSATGSISFGTLHNPTLIVNFGSTIAAPNDEYDIIIIAELNNLVLYNTSPAGATSIQRFTE